MAGLVLGLIDLALARTLRAGAAASAVGLVLSVSLLACAAFAGLAALRRGDRPGWAGALPSLGYGLVSGLSVFYERLTLAQARVMARQEAAKGVPTTAVGILHAANATSTHLLEFFASVLLLTVFGIVVGSLAAVFGRRSMTGGGAPLPRP